MGLPQRPRLSFTCLWSLWTKLTRSHQLTLRAGPSHHWDPVLLLCSCQLIRPCDPAPWMQKPVPDTEQGGSSLSYPGDIGAWLEGQKAQNNDLGGKKVLSIFPPKCPQNPFSSLCPLATVLVHSTSPREGFLKHKSGPVTLLLKILQWLPFAHDWIKSKLSSRTIHGLANSGPRLPVQFLLLPSLCSSHAEIFWFFFHTPAFAHAYFCPKCFSLPLPTFELTKPS